LTFYRIHGSLETSTTGEGPGTGETGISMSHTCDRCHATVSLDRAFLRSVNLRTVAWCRDCWAATHELARVPEQRQPERAPRRWLSLRGR